MSDQYSLKQKFLNLLLDEDIRIQNQLMLNEAVHGATAKIPYKIGADDIKFVNQFDSELWKNAIDARFNLLFDELKKVNEKRLPLLTKKFRMYYPQELKKLQKDPRHSILNSAALEHIAERHAYVKAKTETAAEMPASASQKDLDRVDFKLTTGGSRHVVVPAFPYIYGPAGLFAKIEGTPGKMDGHDLFNPREITTVDEGTGEESTNKITDGMWFPKADQIRDRIDDHLKHMGHGIIEPVTDEEKTAYSENNKRNFKPVRTSRGWLKDTFSKEFYIEEFTKQYYSKQPVSDPEPEKRANAKAQAVQKFVQLVNNSETQGLLTYSNGMPMTGAILARDASGRPNKVELESDKLMDDEGIPINVIKLPHKKIMVNGVEKEVPVLLSGMPFKRIESDFERHNNPGMEIGREFYNVLTNRVEKIFRKLQPHEKRDTYQGKTGYVFSGAMDHNRMSVGTRFLSNLDPEHEKKSNIILNSTYRDGSALMSFTQFVKHIVDSWLAAPCTQDGKDLCAEKEILSHHRDNLYSLAQMKVLNNLGDESFYTQYNTVNIGGIKKSIRSELSRFLQQDLGRGSRKNRHAQLLSRKEALRCEKRIGVAAQCAYNYDIYKFVQEFIKEKLHTTKTKPVRNIDDLRLQVAEELNGVYGMLDLIHLLYEELNSRTAEKESERFRNAVLLLPRNEFVQACETEVGRILGLLNAKTKDVKKKKILSDFKQLFQSHQLGKLDDLVAKLSGSESVKLKEPLSLRQRTEPAEILTPTPVVSKVDQAIEQYKTQMEEEPVLADASLVATLTAGFNKVEKQKFLQAINDSRVSVKAKIHNADGMIRKIISANVVELRDIPFEMLTAFFDQDGSDVRLQNASVSMLQEMLKFLKLCHKVASEKDPRNRNRILRFKSRIDRVDNNINARQ